METNSLSIAIQQITSVIVRLIGMMILFVGLYVGLKVILEAWGLYQTPERIEPFAAAIERGSNMDSIFSATAERVSSEISDDVVMPGTSEVKAGEATPARAQAAPPNKTLRLSYFAAWLIAMMLFLIIGSLAMSAISTGGRLALYDTEMRKFTRQVVREFQRYKKAA